MQKNSATSSGPSAIFTDEFWDNFNPIDIKSNLLDGWFAFILLEPKVYFGKKAHTDLMLEFRLRSHANKLVKGRFNTYEKSGTIYDNFLMAPKATEFLAKTLGYEMPMRYFDPQTLKYLHGDFADILTMIDKHTNKSPVPQEKINQEREREAKLLANKFIIPTKKDINQANKSRVKDPYAFKYGESFKNWIMENE